MQTFEQIQQQIVDLQKQADAMRKQAMAAAIKEVKRLVNLYSLGLADIGLTADPKTKKAAKPSQTQKAAKAPKVAKTSKKPAADKRAAVAPKYRDSETGQTWTGRGKSPTWLTAKIAAGATKESFKI